MSKTNVQLFFEIARSDQDLQNKIKTLLTEKKEQSLENLVTLGSEVGYEFSKEDLLQVVKETAAKMNQGELDDDQLEAVAGGDTPGWVALSIGSYGIGWLLDRLLL